ncbi:DUF1090 domain-containing protein [Pseudomonas jilinensis]|uniref:DUF1090 domain-containing protein n=1 Tax=Pseudomonas jilinensis TaxID=2078689 RepID=A0A396S2K6_9PSED|nr:DUF1090 domain-containing protein [Pseudomonas jilinensis]RHW23111.1 DUF1090 domain-containing protein [Pseudomonas jilinensis]
MQTHLRAYLTLVLLLPLAACAESGPQIGCEAKQTELQQQIRDARDRDQQGRLKGLERALSAVQEHCTDAGLLAEARDKLQESEAEVAERQQDLQHARTNGDSDDIRKRERKLEEALQEREQHRAELEQLERLINAH